MRENSWIGASASCRTAACAWRRSEEHTSELQSHLNLVCRLLLEKKKQTGEIEERQHLPPHHLLADAVHTLTALPYGPLPIHRLPRPHPFPTPAHIATPRVYVQLAPHTCALYLSGVPHGRL